MDRRKFISSSCSLCIAVGAGVVVQSLSACKPTQIYKTTAVASQIKVPLSLFAETDIQLLNVENIDFEIILRKISDGNFSALKLICTHAENPLSVSGKNFLCSLHGSLFDENGEVIKGPAENPLKKFNTQVSQEEIVITIY